MIETNIWMAIKQHIIDNATLPMIFPMDSFELDVSINQVLVSFIPNISQRPNMANDSEHYYEGIFQLTLMSPINRNQENIINHCSDLIDMFPESSKLLFGGVRVHIVKRGDMTQTYRDNGMWRTPINFSYKAFA